MLVKKIIRFCALMVLSGVSSVAFSQTLNFGDAIELAIENGVITVPDTFTYIGSKAFYGVTAEAVVIPESVTGIASTAFSYSNIDHLTLPNSVTTIASSTFEYSSLKSITLHAGITSIGNSAFAFSQLKEINLPNGVAIKEYAFRGAKIEHLVIPDDTQVGSQAFERIPLKSIELGRNLYAYGDNGTASNIFSESTSSLKTVIVNGNIGCSRTSNYGFCFPSEHNPELVVLRDAGISHKVSGPNSTIVANGSSNSNGYEDLAARKVIVVEPVTLTNPLATAPHEVCQNIDTDNDGHQDCYDQFPNDSDRWFDYGDESNDVPQSPSIDTDGDGILDIYDVSNYNHSCSSDISFGADTIDTDQDGVSNYYDCDDDNDGLLDVYETGFPFNYDISVDGLLGGLQLGTNPLNPDSDFDGTLDGLDAFPLDNTESLDTDTDGIGNNADTDDDNDGHFDLLDAFPLDANEWMDSDSDGIGNNADLDDDNDGVADTEDAFPYTASESVDTDGDGVGDNSDAFPNDSSEAVDTDLDGIGNNADDDDDNDGVADAEDSDPLNDSIGALESQNLFVMGNPVAVNGYLTTISVGYDVSDNNNQLNGIGFRMHYDSSIYSYSAVENTLNDSVVVDGMGPYQDIEDFDNDSTTDSYLVFGWASVSGEWPNVELPAKLSDIKMFVNWADYDAGSTTSNINFSIVDNAEGYEGKATNYDMTVLPATWDFDGNGAADALTDGLMLLRYTFNITDLNMTTGAIADNATLSPTQVVDNMHRAISVADIDGNGTTDALTDGLLLLRYLFNLSGESLIAGAISSDATRTSAEEIEQYIELYMPDGLMSPVQSEQNFMVGDWKLASLPEKRELNWDGIGEWGIDEFYGMNLTTFEDCVADDIYRFGNSGTFEYIINGSTYIHPDQNPFFSSGSDYCGSPLSPWSEDEVYSYTVDENKGEVKVIGFGAYLVLSHVADGNDEVDTPAEAPDSITYSYTKLSEDQILFELDAYTAHFRFTLERVLGN